MGGISVEANTLKESVQRKILAQADRKATKKDRWAQDHQKQAVIEKMACYYKSRL